MNKILKLSAIALLASSTSLMAQSKSFEGASLGVGLSIIGAEINGSSTSGDSPADTSKGTIGKISEIASVDLSYAASISNNGLFGIGIQYTPGKAKVGSGSLTDTTPGAKDGTTSASVQVKDLYTIYAMPTYAISKDSAVFAKIGYSQASVSASSTGTATITTQPGDLKGWGYAVGSKTMLTGNTYLQVEASYTDYDTIRATMSNSNVVTADPKVLQATVSIGYKF